MEIFLKKIIQKYKSNQSIYKNIENEYIEIAVKQNCFSVIIASLFAIIFETYNITSVFTIGSGLTTTNNIIMFCFYTSLLLFSIVILFILLKIKLKTSTLYKLHFSASCFYILWNVLFTSYATYKSHEVTALLYIVSIFATMTLMKLNISHKILIIWISFILFVALTFNSLTYSYLVNIIFALLITSYVSIIIFLQQLHTLNYKLQADKANDKLKKEQELLNLSLAKNKIIMNELELFYFECYFDENYIVFSDSLQKELGLQKHIDNPYEWFMQNNIITPEHREAFVNSILQIREGINFPDKRVKILKANGEYSWYRIHIEIQNFKDGKPHSLIGCIQNIDNIKKVNNQITKRVNEQIESNKRYFEYLKATQEKVLKYHHDMRHILKLIDQLIAKEDIESLQNLTFLSQQKLTEIQPNLYCENYTANLILGSFAQMAEKENIKLNYNINMPNSISITSLDLCSILFNLLENALFATKNVLDISKKNIDVKIYIKKNKLFIKVKNYYLGNILMDNNIPVSQNTNEEHGLGVKVIIDTVEKYDGMYLFNIEDDQFSVDIIIPI